MTARTTSEGAQTATVGTEEYTVRPYVAEDESAVRGLGADTPAGSPVEEWLQWYRESPAVDHLPMAVVEQDGDVVAALPFLAVRVRAGEREAIAMAPGHSLTAIGRDETELRQRALAGAMDYYAAATLADRPPRGVDFVTNAGVDVGAALAVEERPLFFFTHDAAPPPEDVQEGTEQARARTAEFEAVGNDEAIGWAHRRTEVRYDRIQRHGSLLAGRIPGPPGRAIGAPISAVGSRVRRARDRRAGFDTEPYTVMHHRGVPAATLGACYEAGRPASTHVAYDREFYRWWARRPDFGPVEAYVVYRGSAVAAGLLVRRDRTRDDDLEVLHIGHVVPVTGDPDRPRAIAAGMERLLDEHAGVDVVRTSNPLVPNAVLSAYGFKRADGLPRSLLVGSADRVVGIRPTVRSEQRLGSRPIGEVVPFLWTIA